MSGFRDLVSGPDLQVVRVRPKWGDDSPGMKGELKWAPKTEGHGKRPPSQGSSSRENLAFAPSHSTQNDIRQEKCQLPKVTAKSREAKQEPGGTWGGGPSALPQH